MALVLSEEDRNGFRDGFFSILKRRTRKETMNERHGAVCFFYYALFIIYFYR